MVSVIVPVYNAEKYIRRCVDSILVQTFNDFELLLIDDGSTDSSGSICEEYAVLDNRVRVFHKVNGGVSSARNLGLENAFGEWVSFIDSDDYVSSTYIQDLYSQINDTVELVISFSVSVFRDKYSQMTYLDKLISRKNFELLITEYDLDWRTSPWAKLYKRSVIATNGMRFNISLPIAEDLVFLYEYLLYIEQIRVKGVSNYFYSAEIEGSLTKRINVPKVEYVCYQNVIGVVNKIIHEKGISSIDAITRLKRLKKTYAMRVINSLYLNKLPRKVRLRYLTQIDSSLLLIDASDTLKDRISAALMSYKLYLVYDFLRMFKKLFYDRCK